MEIIITENEDTIGIIKNGFIEFNKQMLGTYHSRTIAFYIEDIGGIVCKLIKHYIFIEIVWIKEAFRNQGIGKKLWDRDISCV